MIDGLKFDVLKHIKDTGHYKGVHFEMVRYEMRDDEFRFWELREEEGFKQLKFWWAYYLKIDMNKLPNEFNKNNLWLRSITYDKESIRKKFGFENSPLLKKLDWGKGKMSFYEKLIVITPYGREKIVKVGCDYNRSYSCGEIKIHDVENDIDNCIDSFLKLVPGYGEAK